MAATIYATVAAFRAAEGGKELIPIGIVSTGVLATSLAIYCRNGDRTDILAVTLA